MSNNQNETASPVGHTPISHPINVLKLPKKGQGVSIAPDEECLAVLAQHLDVLKVESLVVELVISPWHKDGVRLKGSIRAKLQQECIVTLEPLSVQIDEPVEALFIPENSKLAKRPTSDDGQELIIDAEGEDVPELFTPPFLDIGDVACEFLVLAIDPYPRSTDAEDILSEDHADEAEAAEIEKENPFAALVDLKNKL